MINRMHLFQNKQYFLALNHITNIGPKTTHKLWQRWPDLAELFTLSAKQLIASGLSNPLAKAIATFEFKHIEPALQWELANPQHHILTWGDPHYPKLLREIHDPPVILYAIGHLQCLQYPNIAIIGTRNPSIEGREIAKNFAFELATHGITIISGLALGIDAAAHAGCLDANGATIAVLGTGVNIIYPHRHINLSRQIQKTGLLLSELPLNATPDARHFPRRNRIISGLALHVLVVEAAIKSGSLITARWAIEQNREVMAIPGHINNAHSSGCNYLLQQGAKLITSVNDIIDDFKWERFGATHAYSPNVYMERHESCPYNQEFINYLELNINTFEQIALKSGLSVEKISQNLAELELAGVIKSVPGGYMRCGV